MTDDDGPPAERGTITLALVGDVMLGRGIDQVLAHPGPPRLREEWVTDAREYVALAEARDGPIPRPVAPTWPWGDALTVLRDLAPDALVVNLETAVTRSDEFAPGKAVCYRMSPANLDALTVARPDVVVLANNHVLDFGRRGLEETLRELAAAGLPVAGAGRDAAEAARPAVVGLGDRGRLVVLAFGMLSSGVPRSWAATAGSPGVRLVPHASPARVADVLDRVRDARRPGDVVVASVHWGPNWGYEVGRDEVAFAHALIDGGVDVVHGHSSHHPRPVEVYRGRPILYGCGDFINDYEGIGDFEEYRPDLRVLYVVDLDPRTHALVRLRCPVFRARRFRLDRAPEEDLRGLVAALDSAARPLGTRYDLAPDGWVDVRAR